MDYSMDHNKHTMALRLSFILPSFLLISLFLAELAFDRLLTADGEYARTYLMLTAASRFTILGLLAILGLGATIFRGRPFSFRVPSRLTALTAVSFLAVAFFSGCLGLVYGNDFSYTLGDVFKFSVFPVMIIVVYMSIPTADSFHRLLIATVIIYALFLLKTLVMYFTVLKLNERPLSIYVYPFMPFLTFYLRAYTKGTRMSRLLRVLAVYYILSFPVLVWCSQSLSLILETGFLGAGAWLLHHNVGKKIKIALSGAGAAALLFAFFLVFYPITLFNLFNAVTGTQSYLTSKFHFLLIYGLSMKGLVTLGGDRLSNLLEVASSFYQDPMKFIVGGQGMGSLIKLKTIAGIDLGLKRVEIHFIENAFPEVLYRTGVIGLILYISMFVGLLRKALKWRKENFFCAFSAAYALYILTFSIFNMGFVGDGIGSLYMVSLVYAGVYLIDRQYRHRAPDERLVNQQGQGALLRQVEDIP